jgi:hypothetical protein
MTQFAFGSGTLIGKRTDVSGQPPALLGAPSLTNGQQAALQLDAAGALKVAGLRPLLAAATFTPGTGYTLNENMGGLLTLSFGVANTPVLLDFATVAWYGVTATSGISVVIFLASPSTTFTDGASPTWNSADAAKIARVIEVGALMNAAAMAVWGQASSASFPSGFPTEAKTDSSGNLYVALIAGGTISSTSPGTANVQLGARY